MENRKTVGCLLLVALTSSAWGMTLQTGDDIDPEGTTDVDERPAPTTSAASSGTVEPPAAAPMDLASVACPADCDCFNTYETVDCSRRGLTRLPTLHNATTPSEMTPTVSGGATLNSTHSFTDFTTPPDDCTSKTTAWCRSTPDCATPLN